MLKARGTDIDIERRGPENLLFNENYSFKKCSRKKKKKERKKENRKIILQSIFSCKMKNNGYNVITIGG